jgi:hypothetical protein
LADTESRPERPRTAADQPTNWATRSDMHWASGRVRGRLLPVAATAVPAIWDHRRVVSVNIRSATPVGRRRRARRMCRTAVHGRSSATGC